MSEDLAELLAAERRKTRRLRVALAVTVGLLVAAGAGFAWWADRQAAERQAERARVEMIEAENRRAIRELLERTREAVEDSRAAEVENLLRAAEVHKKMKAFEDEVERGRREAATPAPAPPPRTIGP